MPKLGGEWFEQSVMQSMHGGWLGGGKRLEAVLRVYGRLDKSLELPALTFFAPDLLHAGWAMHRVPRLPVVYLSPALELESLSEVMYTVAHELAHVSLGHTERALDCTGEWEDRPHEQAADALARGWGFVSPRKPKFLHRMIEMYVKGKGRRARKWLQQATGIKEATK